MGSCSPTGQQPTGWASYDSVAETYERVAVPRFAPLARDLVDAVAPPAGATVLDVGSGTGLAARVVLATIGPGASVIGVDPSMGMLSLVRAAPRLRVVAAMAPGLPFPDEVFDTVLANLALSHLPDYAEGLADMARVLRHGGHLACTTWGPNEPGHDDNQRVEADKLVASVIESYGLDTSPSASAVPWEDHFRTRDHLDAALREAGLDHVTIRPSTYRWAFTVDDFLAGWGSRGRHLRHAAGDQLWQQFLGRAAAELRQRFGVTISSVTHAWLATGTRA